MVSVAFASRRLAPALLTIVGLVALILPYPARASSQSSNGFIAFRPANPHGHGIFLMRPDGSDIHELPHTGDWLVGSLAWSSDGRWLAVARTEPSGSIRIWIIDPTGTVKRRLTTAIANPGGAILGLSWAPNGSSIVYSALGSHGSTARLWAVAVATKTKTALVAPTRGLIDVNPRYSPTGTAIAFFAIGNGQIALHMVAPDGSLISEIPLAQASADFAWLRDGQHIAYATVLFNGGQVWAVDIENPSQRTLLLDGTTTDTILSQLVLSPDGTTLLYVQAEARHGLRGATRLLNLSDSETTVIAARPLFDLAWQPIISS
jgi:dipeptidyl aminopeptidase/acylaminoacyl peptidase